MTPEPASGPSPRAVLDAMLAITRECIAAPDEATLADAVVRISAELIDADQGTLGLIRDGEVITVAALMPPRQPVGSHFPVGFGVAGWVAATGRPAEIQDVRQDRRYVALPYPEVRSFVGVPLKTDGALIGVLSLAAWRPGAFAAGAADALAPLAEQAALLLGHIEHDNQIHARLIDLETTARDSLAESLHELKAPLHSVAGFIELVAGEQVGPLNPQQRDFLETARSECAHLKDALATLVEAGAAAAQRPLELHEVEPSELVGASVQRLRGQALSRDVCLTPRIEASARAVRADRAAILQVLANFLQNALRVAPAGSEIEVGAAGEPGWTCFVVEDRGPGLPPHDTEALFERYHQGDRRDRERSAGEVGLGLALSRRIVEQHAGRIWAENRRDGGARFAFALPAV